MQVPNGKNKAPCGGGHVCYRALFNIYINDILVLVSDLNNVTGDPPSGRLDGIGDNIYDRYSQTTISKDISQKIGAAATNDQLLLSIRPAPSNSNPHFGVTWVRMKDSDGKIVFSSCVNGSPDAPPVVVVPVVTPTPSLTTSKRASGCDKQAIKISIPMDQINTINNEFNYSHLCLRVKTEDQTYSNAVCVDIVPNSPLVCTPTPTSTPTTTTTPTTTPTKTPTTTPPPTPTRTPTSTPVCNVSAQLVNMTMVPVGNVGNVADTGSGTFVSGYGSVAYSYQIGAFEVTGSEYTAFLNAVASTDTHGLYYDPANYGPDNMGTNRSGARISRSGESGSYTYSVLDNTGNFPIALVTWWNCVRFCNWMSNGQPSGVGQNGTSTENGAYTLPTGVISGPVIAANLINPNTNWIPTFRMPTENEWYKAAYYDPTLNSGSGGYWTYATRSNDVLTATIGNTQTIVDVGTKSPSFYGTYDQSGSVEEKMESDDSTVWSPEHETDPNVIPYRGGRYFDYQDNPTGTWWDESWVASDSRYEVNSDNADSMMGFRLASSSPCVPTPAPTRTPTRTPTNTQTRTPAPTSTMFTNVPVVTPGVNSLNWQCSGVWDNETNGTVTTVGTNGGRSAHGTYDQGGNLEEWNDLDGTVSNNRGFRGAMFQTNPGPTDQARKDTRDTYNPDSLGSYLGFRVAATTETNDSDLVIVGPAFNAADSTGYGAVNYVYRIGKYEVTNSQWCSFLNSVADTDTYGLYNALQKITRTGSPGTYAYAPQTNYDTKPVNFVTWFACARYVNWKSNSDTIGPQNNTTTEDGAYTLNGLTSGNAVVKNAINPNTYWPPTYWIPTENEWYKAAYYKGGGTNAGYWDYTTQSDSVPGYVTATETGDGVNP